MNKKILVTGGAGYIGSHMTDMLKQSGYEPIVFDNLSGGFKDAILDAKLEIGDLNNLNDLNQIFTKHNFNAVMHFAASIRVEESVKDPEKYYFNNLVNTLNLLSTMRKHDVKIIIFSSSAAIYGEPKYSPIDEDHPKNPVNPYGRSKLMIEQILQDYSASYYIRSISLRYFNAAGADPKGRMGERHDPETHLIPLILQTASGRREAINIYGNDYETKDGTCIRDYIHIVDLCQAHLLALKALFKGAATNAYNLGNGNGFSVLEAVDTARNVTKKDIKTIACPRRGGDPQTLVANSKNAKKELGWKPIFSDLKTIIEHAWQWEQKMGKEMEKK